MLIAFLEEREGNLDAVKTIGGDEMPLGVNWDVRESMNIIILRSRAFETYNPKDYVLPIFRKITK